MFVFEVEVWVTVVARLWNRRIDGWVMEIGGWVVGFSDWVVESVIGLWSR